MEVEADDTGPEEVVCLEAVNGWDTSGSKGGGGVPILSGTGGGRSEGDGDDGGAESEFEDEDAGAGGVDDGEVEGPEGCRILSSAGEVVENGRGARSTGATRREAAVRSIVMRAERWCEVCEGECRELSGPSWSWMKRRQRQVRSL